MVSKQGKTERTPSIPVCIDVQYRKSRSAVMLEQRIQYLQVAITGRSLFPKRLLLWVAECTCMQLGETE